jgi:hypothetical protein
LPPDTLTGRDYKIAAYGVTRETELIDIEEIRDLALRNRPQADHRGRVGLSPRYCQRLGAEHIDAADSFGDNGMLVRAPLEQRYLAEEVALAQANVAPTA